MQNINETNFKINPKIIFREEEFGALIFNRETNRTYNLNHFGAFIFKLVEENRDIGEIVDILSKKYIDINKKTIQNDVDNFLINMKKAGVLL